MQLVLNYCESYLVVCLEETRNPQDDPGAILWCRR